MLAKVLETSFHNIMKPYYIADKFHSDMPTAAGIDGERRGWREEQY